VEEVQRNSGSRQKNRIYAPLVVMWLMVMQRLHGGSSLEVAVLELIRGLPESFWPRPCKRVREWREQGKEPSSHTGAYNQARLALPRSIVEQSCDRLFQQLVTRMDQTACGNTPGVFLLDGSSMRLPHNEALCERYPVASNQHGDLHWPVLRILVAHDLRTGLAMRPEWGAMHGPDAVSEQGLLEKAIDRLPGGSTVMGDANFGVFSVAYAATQRQHPVLLRLTAARASRLAGGVLQHGINRNLNWEPSRDDRRSHPDLPADACVRGRLIVRQVQPNNGGASFVLAVFTTLPGSPTELFALYGQRWTIETDLRTLKSTLCLDQLTCSTPDMVAKEIDMGIAAYNLVRAMIGFASEQSGLPARGFSFTKVRQIMEIFGPELAHAPNPQAAQKIFDRMMRCVQQSRLPRRKRKRSSYPRQLWGKGTSFPPRKR
jgi:hypothetical protein